MALGMIMILIVLRTGYINHSLFWKNLAPELSESKGNGGTRKDGLIVAAFSSLDNLKKEFNTTTAGIQGSGWGWLVCRSIPALAIHFLTTRCIRA